jgi:hypothetical protein
LKAQILKKGFATPKKLQKKHKQDPLVVQKLQKESFARTASDLISN